MTLREFIEKTRTDKALNAKVNASIMEKVIMPMAAAEGVELTDDDLLGVSGGYYLPVDHVSRYNSSNGQRP